MSYFQDVVTEYLRADRSMFVNTECLIQLDATDTPAKGRHWSCDAVAVSFRESKVYLCEVTYSKTLDALIKRLQAWSTNWPGVCEALGRDCALPREWRVQPWVFIPKGHRIMYEKKIVQVANLGDGPGQMPYPRIEDLESVTPWNYRTWDRKVSALDEATERSLSAET